MAKINCERRYIFRADICYVLYSYVPETPFNKIAEKEKPPRAA